MPVYNGTPTLNALVDRLQAVLDPRDAPYEIILVNDDSTDDSWVTIEALSRRHPCVHGIDLMRNYGQHNAVLAGVRVARFDLIVTLDDDLQHPPEEIPKLIGKLAEGHDVVYGTPEHEQHGVWRQLAKLLTQFTLERLLGVRVARHVTSFRAFRSALREAFTEVDGPYLFLDAMLAWGSTRFAAVAVRHEPRREGSSGYGLGRLMLHAVNMTTGFSAWPLRLASLVGFTFTLFGAGILVYVLVWHWLEGRILPGFTFLAAIVSIYSGAQLFALGILGEYLARIHFRSMRQPAHVVRRRTPERSDDPAGGCGRGPR